MKFLLLGLFVLVICLLGFGGYKMFQRAAHSQVMEPRLGVNDGQLAACPSSPNCVSSYADSDRHAIEALPGGAEEFSELTGYIISLENTQIRVLTEDYLWATYKTGFFGFVDDLELYFDGAQIQVRSASREGYSDLGANRARVETLRTYLKER